MDICPTLAQCAAQCSTRGFSTALPIVGWLLAGWFFLAGNQRRETQALLDRFTRLMDEIEGEAAKFWLSKEIHISETIQTSSTMFLSRLERLELVLKICRERLGIDPDKLSPISQLQDLLTLDIEEFSKISVSDRAERVLKIGRINSDSWTALQESFGKKINRIKIF